MINFTTYLVLGYLTLENLRGRISNPHLYLAQIVFFLTAVPWAFGLSSNNFLNLRKTLNKEKK